MTIGIYSIRNKIDGKRYIGKSNNIERRLAYHKRNLTNPIRNSKSTNRYLYNAVQKYGWENFETEILHTFEYVDEYKLGESELIWMIEYNTIDARYDYNLRLDTATKMIVSDDTRELNRINSIGEKNPNYGNRWSDDAKSRMSDIKKHQHSIGLYGDEWKRKISDKSKRFWHENPDVKSQMAEKVSKSKMKYEFHQMDDDCNLVKKWSSVKEIIEAHPDWKWQQIYSVCNGHKKRIYGYKWKKVLKNEN